MNPIENLGASRSNLKDGFEKVKERYMNEFLG